jgi:hypothetical protein
MAEREEPTVDAIGAAVGDVVGELAAFNAVLGAGILTLLRDKALIADADLVALCDRMERRLADPEDAGVLEHARAFRSLLLRPRGDEGN